MLIWILGACIILLFAAWIFRHHILWTYESVLIWLAIRRAQRELNKIGKGDIANAIRWDEKWYGRKN